MSNKENLIFALADAEDNQREIEIRHVGIATTSMLRIVPELLDFGDAIEIYDEDFRMTVDFNHVLGINYDHASDEYAIATREGNIYLSFSIKG